MVTIIIPTYNEEAIIVQTLERLQQVRGDFEVIAVDGASADETVRRVEAVRLRFSRPLSVIATERNRATQLNRAAAGARGNSLLFLHADAMLPLDAVESVERALARDSIVGGNFQLRFEGHLLSSRFFTWANRLRRRFGIYYGDSAIFARREVFERLGGFRPIPIMDDYDFVQRMERMGRTVCLEPVVTVSDRRWRRQGVLPTLWSWFWVQVLYSLGVSPRYLAQWYGPVRDGTESQARPLAPARQLLSGRS